ncbi:2-keto-4-pentenoate hydratase [Streptomyces albogriseolus]|uniref:2-keto-4-pentenoate hydratase n=1 Tax=Streptomyces albogriseolus TaxID=1887 RepID=UPI0036F095D6
MDEQDDRWIAAAASALLAAERERISIEALTVQRPDLSLAMAYRVQAATVARQVAGGARVVGHKAGVTSRAMQEQMGVDEPDSGVLLDHMVLPTGSTVARCALMQPRVEAEIAFRLGCDLTGENVGFEEARAAVKEVFLALEVIDTRFAGWRLTIADSIADNASCARVVTGPMVPFSADMDLAGDAASGDAICARRQLPPPRRQVCTPAEYTTRYHQSRPYRGKGVTPPRQLVDGQLLVVVSDGPWLGRGVRRAGRPGWEGLGGLVRLVHGKVAVSSHVTRSAKRGSGTGISISGLRV